MSLNRFHAGYFHSAGSSVTSSVFFLEDALVGGSSAETNASGK
jgi:hypothetical protein